MCALKAIFKALGYFWLKLSRVSCWKPTVCSHFIVMMRHRTGALYGSRRKILKIIGVGS